MGRSQHSSCTLGQRVYVISGGKPNQPVESLLAGQAKAEWDVINEPRMIQEQTLTERCNAAVAPINDHEIVVFGGHRNGTFFYNGYCLNTENLSSANIKPSIRRIDTEWDESDVDAQTTTVWTHTQTQQIYDGRLYTLGRTRDLSIQLVCVTMSAESDSDSCHTVRDYGKILFNLN